MNAQKFLPIVNTEEQGEFNERQLAGKLNQWKQHVFYSILLNLQKYNLEYDGN